MFPQFSLTYHVFSIIFSLSPALVDSQIMLFMCIAEAELYEESKELEYREIKLHILGISCFYHDSAATLLRDGDLIAAAEEERFTRKKHDFGFPENAIRFCLEFAGIGSEDLATDGHEFTLIFYQNYTLFSFVPICVNSWLNSYKPFGKFERNLMTTFQTFPRSWKVFQEAMVTWLLDKLWIKSIIKEKVGVEEKKILFCDHHLSHAASAFFCSPLTP